MMKYLKDYFAQDMTKLVKTAEADGEGGTQDVWTKGDSFVGILILNRSNPTTDAEATRLSNTYTLTVSRDLDFSFNEVFEDAKGDTYRTISKAKETPNCTSLDMKQYTVERWDIE